MQYPVYWISIYLIIVMSGCHQDTLPGHHHMNSDNLSRLAKLLASEDADDLTGDLQSLILEHKPDDTSWSRPEYLVVILCSMEGRVLNGGFKGYLCMPTSIAVKDAIAGLKEIGCNDISDALAQAYSMYPEGDAYDGGVAARQAHNLSDSEYRHIAKLSGVFYDNTTRFQDCLVSYVKQNRDSFTWINDLPDDK